MNSKTLALRSDVLTDLQRLEYIETFGRMIYSGHGTASNFSRQIGVSEADALRVFLGIPSSNLTDTQRRVYEAVYAYVLGLPVKPRPELWTDAPEWMPQNPRRTDDRSIEVCCLDFEFIESFGIRRGVWEKEILLADLGAVAAKAKRGGDLSGSNLRLYMALAMFGFRDPSQFFI